MLIPTKKVCDICGDVAGELSKELVDSDVTVGDVLQCEICGLDRCPSCTDWCCEDNGRSYKTFDGVYLKTSLD